MTSRSALERMRAICLALPSVTERPNHGAPTWFVQDKKRSCSPGSKAIALR